MVLENARSRACQPNVISTELLSKFRIASFSLNAVPAPGDATGRLETLLEAVQVVERDRGAFPALIDGRSELGAQRLDPGDEGTGAGQHRTERRIEVLVQRHVNRIKESGVSRHGNARVRGREKQACSVEVRADLFSSVPNPLVAGHRAYELIRCISSKSTTCPMVRRTGDSIEIAPTGAGYGGPAARSTAFVISSAERVARPGPSGTRLRPLRSCAQSPSSRYRWLLLLDERFAALSGQHSNGEVIRERAGGKEESFLLSEDGGHACFEVLHGAVLEITVAAKMVLLGNRRQQPRVVGRGGIQAVAK